MEDVMAKKDKVVEGTEGTEAVEVKKDLGIPEGTMVMCDDGVERAVLSRESAIAMGTVADETYGTVLVQNRYFTGVKCALGHMAERKVKGYVCVVCARERMKDRKKKRVAADPLYKKKLADARKAKHAEKYANDPEYKAAFLAKGKARRQVKAAEKAASPEGIKAQAEKEAKEKSKLVVIEERRKKEEDRRKPDSVAGSEEK
jgi:hypothetical protein